MKPPIQISAGKRLIAISLASLLVPLAPMQVLAQQYYQPYQQQPYYPQQQAYGPPQYPQQPAYSSPQQAYPPQQPAYPQYQQAYPPQQPYAQPQYAQPAYGGGYAQPPMQAQPLAPQQLDQLVAPIALYPDALVAQVLTASTYANQVADADRWRQSMGYAPAEQIAAGANAQNWDPSVKALTAFPQVLSEMDRNMRWTSDLGNAYYNQPQDVLAAIQDMRQRAQAAGSLQNTPQETVSYDQGNIELAPANPQVVYVPSYNPWAVYGAPVSPYPGFSLLGAIGSFVGSALLSYGPGIMMGAFNATPFGFIGWGLSWLASAVLFHSSNYFTHSTTVFDRGFAHGGPRAFMGGGYARAGFNSGYGRGFAQRGPVGYAARPPMQQAYNRMQPAINNPRTYDRPAYGSSFMGARPGGYAQPSYRAPAAFQGNNFAQRGGFQDKNFGKSFGGFSGKPSGGGFHPFGGGNKAPKGFGGGGKSFGGHGGGGHGGGHLFGKHH
jgi:hypothetical protein